MKKILLLMFLLLALFSSRLWAADMAAGPKGEAAARGFVEELLNGPENVIYAFVDPEVKATTSEDAILDTVQQIKKLIPKVDSIHYLRAYQNAERKDLVAFEYEVASGNSAYTVTVVLKQKDENHFTVAGFHTTMKPRKLTDTKGATPFHFVMILLAAACVLATLASLGYFATRRNDPKKWVYAAGSLIGFPVGLGLNWTTGAILLRLGFNIPPVSFSAPAQHPGMWTITVFFPLGLFFMIWHMRKSKKEPPEGASL
ncbi:MAG TPA: hypothetical protein VL688_09800 [Verrucomicrobiae bacterium]|nr:hypothetical protein [Verrucomicrobiae bacterium]